MHHPHPLTPNHVSYHVSCFPKIQRALAPIITRKKMRGWLPFCQTVRPATGWRRTFLQIFWRNFQKVASGFSNSSASGRLLPTDLGFLSTTSGGSYLEKGGLKKKHLADFLRLPRGRLLCNLPRNAVPWRSEKNENGRPIFENFKNQIQEISELCFWKFETKNF